MSSCSIPGCKAPHRARGLCWKHWTKWRLTTPIAGKCSIDGCDAVAYAKGLCRNHYMRAYRHGTTDLAPKSATRGMTAAERFWHYVERSDDCWLWQGELNVTGYGRMFDGKRRVFAHRFAYELLKAPIPKGLPLDHLCRTPACVNPDHLEPVTTKENVRRGIAPAALNARKTHCMRGHEFTAENTDLDSNGGRHCRTCRMLRNK